MGLQAANPGDRGSGPAIAALFHRCLALVAIDAWVSLLRQLDLMIGSHGLIPWAPTAASVEARAIPFAEFPTLLRWCDSDRGLMAAALLGLGLSLAALVGLRPRICLGLGGLLYSSFMLAAGHFFSFQWDNLLVECSFLVLALPIDRPGRWAHLLFRVLLFKLYWESGVAKFQSSIRDWHDGSAMTYYYETAPLPAWPGWFAHHLPVFWHHLESWGALGLELLIPLLIFGPRRGRLVALASLTGFQLLNLATANYGFFVYLAITLHLFLLDDADVPPRLRSLLRVPEAQVSPPEPGLARRAGAAAAVAVYVALSAVDGMASFAEGVLPEWVTAHIVVPVPIALVNTYHLFGSITRERLEPQFETQDSQGAWAEHDLWHKPGRVDRHPDFVAPHQPRIDFLLWFYGLASERRPPQYVASLLRHLCDDPDSIQGLFPDPLPAKPQASRVVFWRYHFSSWDELRSQGAWWTRDEMRAGPTLRCP